MPVQRTFLGRPIALRMPPRRFQLLFGLIAFVAFATVLLSGPQNVEDKVERVKEQILENIPQSIHSSFRPVHKPPVQGNSTWGNSSWFTDWQWRNPFSSTVAQDDDRVVLPPPKPRPFVYTVYEPNKSADKEILKAEEKILLVWRRAWWAQGFRPIVLGRDEAMNNALYQKFELLRRNPGRGGKTTSSEELDKSLEYEILRWLAWGHMGTGVLVNWLALPMAAYDDDLLNFLRRGEYPKVSHFEQLGNNMFCGEQGAINELLTSVLDNPEALRERRSVIDAAEPHLFNVEKLHNAIALYETAILQQKYRPVADLMTSPSTEAQGLEQLAELMNAHLHTTWQNTFSSGIAILKPLKHTTVLIEPAVEIAKSLQQCSLAPVPDSCPPNRECQPCTALGMKIDTVPSYKNDSDLFVIGPVPHPYTASMLHNWKRGLDDLSLRFIRRHSLRDLWLGTITKELLGPNVGSTRRIVAFKDTVAGDFGSCRSLWLTAESESHKDLNWIFGFGLPLPQNNTNVPVSNSTTTAPAAAESPSEPLPGQPGRQELEREKRIIDWAREAIHSKEARAKKIREAVEAWNLADTEAWKFAGAYSGRRRMERLKWEEEERKYAGAESGRASRWWF